MIIRNKILHILHFFKHFLGKIILKFKTLLISQYIEKYYLLIFTFVIFLIFIICTLIMIYKPYSIGQDQSMYLFAGEAIINGKIPFIDFYDINPPLIMYFSAVIVKISKFLNFHSIIIFKVLIYIYFFILQFYIFKFYNKIKSQTDKSQTDKSQTEYLTVMLMFTISFCIDILQSSMGQRDSLFYMSLFIYLLIRSSKNIKNTYLYFFIFLFSIFTAFKPYFFFHILITEIYFIYINKWNLKKMSLEFKLIVLFQALYFIYLIYLPGIQGDFFWNTHVPQVIKYYNSFKYQITDHRIQLNLLVITSLLALLYYLFSYKKNMKNVLLNLVYINLGISIFVFYVQQNQFLYQSIGITYFICISSVFILNNKNYIRILVIPLILFSILDPLNNIYKIFYKNSISIKYSVMSDLYQIVLNHTAPNDYILPLSSSVWMTYPVVNIYSLQLASPYLFQYPISFFGNLRWSHDLHKFNDNPILTEQEIKYTEQIKTNIKKYHPKIIYFLDSEDIRQNLPLNFPLFKYLEILGIIQFAKQNGYKLNIKNSFYYLIK